MSELELRLGGVDTTVSVTREGKVWEIRTIERQARIELLEMRDGEVVVRIDGARATVPFRVRGDEIDFFHGGSAHTVVVASLLSSRARKRHHEHSMSAPMPGVILQVLVGAGDRVTRGQALLVLEAMKMEHQITAPYDGAIEHVHCAEGEMVQPGVDLISMTPEEPE